MAQDASQVKSATSVNGIQKDAGSSQDALKQFAESASSGDGTFFQQLTSNPFFTAVCKVRRTRVTIVLTLAGIWSRWTGSCATTWTTRSTTRLRSAPTATAGRHRDYQTRPIIRMGTEVDDDSVPATTIKSTLKWCQKQHRVRGIGIPTLHAWTAPPTDGHRHDQDPRRWLSDDLLSRPRTRATHSAFPKSLHRRQPRQDG